MDMKPICETLSYAFRQIPALEPHFVIPHDGKHLHIRLLSQGGMVLQLYKKFGNGTLADFEVGLIGICDNCSNGADDIEYKGPFYSEKEMESSEPDCFVGLWRCPFYRLENK